MEDRYGNIEHTFALALYFKSAWPYDFFLLKLSYYQLHLLRYWLQRIKFKAGWNESVSLIIKQKATSMSKMDKVFGVVFDAMLLKKGI